MIKQSAGVALTWNKSILLVHPTNASWKNTLSIPKGLVDEGEDLKVAAVRELKEETGIAIGEEHLSDAPLVINYENKGKIYKQLTVYFLYADDKLIAQLQITGRIPKAHLQLDEVDWAGFIPLSEVETKIMPRLMPVVEAIMKKYSHA